MVTKPGIIFLLFVGALYTTDAAITAWTEPEIDNAASGTGAYTFAENIATGSADVSTQFAATTDETDGIVIFSLLTTDTPFSVADDGVLSLDTALDFETTETYTLEVQAADNKPSTGTATITITITDVNEFEPVFSPASYSPCIADKSPAGTTLTTVTATDKDTSQTISYDIETGDTGNDFKIDPDTGLIQVNDAKTLNKTATASYALVVTAVDDLTTIRTGTTTVSVTVADSCGGGGDGGNGDSGAAVAVASMVMLFVSLVVTLF